MKRNSPVLRLFVLTLSCASLLALSACAVKTSVPGPSRPQPPVQQKAQELPRVVPPEPAPPAPSVAAPVGPIAETWQPLLARLKADGLDSAAVRRVFAELGDCYSAKPMGTKITELFTYRYLRQPRPSGAPPPVTSRVYPGFTAPAVLERCREFLAANAAAFARAEQRYAVPRETIVSLLMVETKLGSYLGSANAFWSLACMASATTPARITDVLETLPGIDDKRLAWIGEKLAERSAWAYKELTALIRHAEEHGLDPLSMPGSVYGAIGLCQFMPSNLKPYGADGNEDGRVDLFDPADAIASVGNYLAGHGWKKGLARDGQHRVLKRYNNSTVYANTILGLAGALAETL